MNKNTNTVLNILKIMEALISTDKRPINYKNICV